MKDISCVMSKGELVKESLVIVGAGGHGRVVADIALALGWWRRIFFFDDNKFPKRLMGIDVVGKVRDVDAYLSECDVIVAIGDNRVREKIQMALKRAEATMPALVHPRAVIGTDVRLGAGTVVMAGAVINCCTTIGEGCIINTGATIDHDVVIEDFVHISPGAHLAGTVRVGRRSWLGVGCAVSNNVSITGDCVIGAGAVVISNIEVPGTYVGVPVRMVRKI